MVHLMTACQILSDLTFHGSISCFVFVFYLLQYFLYYAALIIRILEGEAECLIGPPLLLKACYQ